MLAVSALAQNPEQEEFLPRIVTNYLSGVHSPFIFVKWNTGSGVRYPGAAYLAWTPQIEEIDLHELAQAGLITLMKVGEHYQGKPTAAAIAEFLESTQAVTADLAATAETATPELPATTESAATGLLAPMEAATLELPDAKVTAVAAPTAPTESPENEPDIEKAITTISVGGLTDVPQSA